MVQHTKTPWKLILPLDESNPEYDEENDEHSRIAIYMGDRLTSSSYFSTANEIVFASAVAPGEDKLAEANARYIVKAVNNHERLVDALEALLSGIEGKTEMARAKRLAKLALTYIQKESC